MPEEQEKEAGTKYPVFDKTEAVEAIREAVSTLIDYCEMHGIPAVIGLAVKSDETGCLYLSAGFIPDHAPDKILLADMILSGHAKAFKMQVSESLDPAIVPAADKPWH